LVANPPVSVAIPTISMTNPPVSVTNPTVSVTLPPVFVITRFPELGQGVTEIWTLFGVEWAQTCRDEREHGG